jgi:uncharacterized protein (DUF58 family)
MSALSESVCGLLPAPRLVALAGLWSVVTAAALLWALPAEVWELTSLVAVLMLVVDAGVLLPPSSVQGTRGFPGSMPIGEWREVQLRIRNAGKLRLHCEVFDHYPAHCEQEGLPARIAIAPEGWTELRYRVKAQARGAAEFGRIELRLYSPLRLWQKRVFTGSSHGVKVYPNFAALSKYALLATDNRLSQIGVLRRRRRGEGLDFDQLREYQEGDSLRKIDWKASQRMNKLISREYQDERDQQVVFLIDCGRRMTAVDDETSHFDHALDATLLLAYVGLRQGDSVGLLTMNGPARYLAPSRSAAAVNRILAAVYDLQPGAMAPDYYSAAVNLSRRLRKRALVVIITNLRDEDDDTLAPGLRLLQRRHLVVLANLRERVVDDTLSGPTRDFNDALTRAAAAEYRLARDAAFNRLRREHVVCLDVEPQKLAIALVNQYLDIKVSGRL